MKCSKADFTDKPRWVSHSLHVKKSSRSLQGPTAVYSSSVTNAPAAFGVADAASQPSHVSRISASLTPWASTKWLASRRQEDVLKPHSLQTLCRWFLPANSACEGHTQAMCHCLNTLQQMRAVQGQYHAVVQKRLRKLINLPASPLIRPALPRPTTHRTDTARPPAATPQHFGSPDARKPGRLKPGNTEARKP